MRSVGSGDDNHEKKPMLETEMRSDVSKNGAIDIPEPPVTDHQHSSTDSGWLNRRFGKLSARKWLIGIVSIAALIAIIVFIYSVHYTSLSALFRSPNDEIEGTEDYSWYDKTCKSAGQCKKDGYSEPPLLIISFDGFSYKYMEKNIMKSLTYFSNCGVKANRVIPCFPSRTFPNHYTIATGLYPESHGIVDNNIYDPKISPSPQSTKNTKHNELWMGTPIWKAYHDQTNKKTACLFWPGCAYNISGYKPEESPTYDKSVALEDRFELVHKWLSEKDHPKLVLAYVEQPDSAGHNQKSEKEVDDALEELDGVLNKFLTNLDNDGLLDCINIAIVSDHGMQLLNNLVFIPDFFNSSDVVATQGVIGRLFSDNKTTEQLAEPFTCQKVEGVRVFDRLTMPVRKHHAKIPRVGDVILQGEPGTTFDIKRRGMLAADHGYDIIHESMHTIFFARGPSFKKNFTVSSFQHVEYMNLWTNLLNITAVPNNGSAGFMDVLLTDPPRRKYPVFSEQHECESQNNPTVEFCGACEAVTQEFVSTGVYPCETIESDYLHFEYEGAKCVRKYCKTTLIGQSSAPIAILEEVHRSDLLNRSSCEIAVTKYGIAQQCDSQIKAYLSSNTRSPFGKMAEVGFNATDGFIETVLNPLNTLTTNYVKKFGLIWTISGLAYDADLDGISDSEKSNERPSHLYRTIFYCISIEDAVCTGVDVISFIFPLISTDVNCLTPEELLIEYTARLKDVEMISGFRWRPKDLSPSSYHSMRIHINLGII